MIAVICRGTAWLAVFVQVARLVAYFFLKQTQMLKLPIIRISRPVITCAKHVSFNTIRTAPSLARTFQTTTVLQRRVVKLPNDGPLPLRVMHPAQAETIKLNSIQDNPGSKFQVCFKDTQKTIYMLFF